MAKIFNSYSVIASLDRTKNKYIMQQNVQAAFLYKEYES